MKYASLEEFIHCHPRLLVLTGAGCSTVSGIPDYRDGDGGWKRTPPMMFQTFIGDPYARRRYWARSLAGWRRFRRAKPNDAHRGLALLEASGRTELVVTQNVDRLHQAAGSRNVIDLHGRLDLVRCLGCERRTARDAFQSELLRRNPAFAELDGPEAPDGDADIDELDFDTFDVPGCAKCGGLLKPDVVFFGESVPKERVTAAMNALERADALLVVGSSLMVYSGYRFARAAAAGGKPIAALNLGRTRADELLSFKAVACCAEGLGFLLHRHSDFRNDAVIG